VQSFTLTINQAPVITSASSTTFTEGATGSFTVTATGSPTPSITESGALPGGVTFNAGILGGTPTASGTFPITFTASNGVLPNAVQNFTLTVSPTQAPAITSASSTTFTEGVAGSFTVTATGSPTPSITESGALPGGVTFIAGILSGTPSASGTFPITFTASNGVSPNAVQNFTLTVNNPAPVYTVSGTVTYTGSYSGSTDWIYLELNSNNCNGCGGSNLGTSIRATTLKSGGAFTIHGVQPGTYTLQAYLDNLGYGAENASNPTGSIGNVTVTNVGVSVGSVALTDPGTVTLSSAPTWKNTKGSGTFSGGAFISYQSIQNNNGIEMAASYTVEWSTSSTFATIAGNKSFPATGGSDTKIVSGLTNGDTYYFRVQGVAVGGSTSNWSAASNAMTIGAPTGGNKVTGQVTFSEKATGPLYVGFYDQNTSTIYATVVGSETTPPTSPASYTVQVPTGSNYYFFGILDQNNSGFLSGAGQVSNTNENNIAPVAITGTTVNEDLTLPSGNSVAVVMTQAQEQINSNGTNSNYSIGFNVNGLIKMPVAVELATETSAGVVIPSDIASGGFNGNSDQFSFWTGLNGATPKAGDSYGLKVTYSDGTSETLTAAVTAVLNAFATNLSPQGNGVSLTPTFSWTDPATGNYTYQFWLCCNSNNNGNNTIWQIPGNNSNSNGFSSSITSIQWNKDPTNSNPPDLPNVSSLNGSTNYTWQIQASDVNGNSAQVQVSFETLETQLSLLPAGGALSSGTVEQGYNASISASGGSGSGYVFTVNGSLPPGLSYGTNNNSLNISGAPNTTGSYPFTVQVTDSENHIAGPYTYTITVDNYAPVSLPAASSDPLGSALVGISYAGTINASGGAGGGNYSFTVNGTTVPTNMTYVSVPNGDGLTVANSGGNTLSFAGTPATVETVSLAVTVIDTTNSSDTASVTYTLPVVAGPNGANNGNLKGTYVCKLDGFSDSDGTRWASLSSVTADGKGNLTGGIWDTNGTDFTTEESGTLSGTYSIGADNNGLATTIAVATSGGSGTHTSQFALALTNAVEPAQQFRMVETDDIGSSSSGQHSTANCYLATTSAFAASTISGHSFVFGMQGENSSGTPKAYVGRFAASGGTINSGIIDGMRLDQTGDDGGTFAGTYTAPNTTYGRFTLTITPTGQSSSVTMAVYIIDANRMFMLETAGDSGVQAGDVRKQLQTSYSGANLNAKFVLYSQAYEYSNGSVSAYDSYVFQGTGNSTGGLTINQSYSDKNGTYQVGGEDGGPIAVTFDTSNPGRATFSPGGSDSVYLYFFNNNSAIELDLSSNGYLESGWVEAQSQTTFTDAAVAGNYMLGQLPPMSATQNGNVGEFDLSSAGGITGGITTAGEGYFTWDQAQTMTYSWDTSVAGAGTFLVADPSNPGKGGASCAVISATKAACIIQSDKASVLILQQ
jgi:hypothetical protein